MKTRLLFLAVFLSSTFMVINIFESASDAYITEKNGVEVSVEIVERPICGKSNKIKVLYNGKRYSVYVAKNNCIGGDYYIGKKVEVVFYDKIGKMIMAHHNNNWGYYLSILFFIIPLFFFILLVLPFEIVDEQ